MDNRRRAKIWRATLALVAAGAAAACNAPNIGPRAPLQVRTEAAKFVDFAPTLALTGSIAARIQSDVSFRTSGRVTERQADVGAHVKVGDVLARLDPAQAEADLDSAQAAVVAAQAVLTQSTTAYQRQQSLLASGFTTRTTYDAAVQTMKTAQGSLDSAKAQLGTAEDALSYTELKADHDGVVTARSIEVGQVVAPAQAAFTIAHDGARDAVFDVFEAAILSPPAAGDVKIWLVSDPKAATVGHVREVSPTVDAKTGAVRVKVGLDASGADMPLGAPVVGQAALRPRKAVILPWSAASTSDGRLAVWIVDPHSHLVTLQTVTPDTYENKALVIADGLAPGAEVVTEGGKFLFPGAEVAPLEGAR